VSPRRPLAIFIFLTFVAGNPAWGAPPSAIDLGSQLLLDALQEISTRHFRQAVADLRDFAARYPEHVYDDYGHYWLAYSHYQLGEYALAEVTSDFLIYRHPYSFKIADAKLLNAMSRMRRGDRTQAPSDLKALLEKNPHSNLAPLAEALLFSNPRH
jgi:TolA-binding protein